MTHEWPKDDRRETTNSILARGRSKNIMCQRERGKKMIQWLESEYGEMHGSRGKRHDYLGMWLDYSTPGEVCISTEEYLWGVLDNFTEEITETPGKPAASNLFNVREDSEQELLNETRAQSFHHTVAQLLFTGI